MMWIITIHFTASVHVQLQDTSKLLLILSNGPKTL